MIVQLSKLEELSSKCLRQLHFPKCLPSSPCTECSWLSGWEWGGAIQYSGKCACLKTVPTMRAQYIPCFPFPARSYCRSSKNQKDKFHPVFSLDACTSLWALAMCQHFPLTATSPSHDIPITTDKTVIIIFKNPTNLKGNFYLLIANLTSVLWYIKQEESVNVNTFRKKKN